MQVQLVSAKKKPVDVDGIVATLRKVLSEGGADEMFGMLALVLDKMNASNVDLELRLAKLLRERFGRKTERIDPAQLALFLEALTAEAPGTDSKPEDTPDIPPTEDDKKKNKGRRGKRGRKPLPADIPRRKLVVKLPPEECGCPQCGTERRIMGYECGERLDYEPGGFFVVEVMREKGVDACDCLARPALVTAPPIDEIIISGIPGCGLLAKVVIAKYADHLPLERQSTMYAREGVDLSPSTMCDWVAQAAFHLTPLARRIEELALLSVVLCTDDTGLTVLDQKRAKGTKRGHMWIYCGDTRWAAFKYTPDWKACGPQEFLATRVGYLVVDGYAGYKKLFLAPDSEIIEVGCMMHSRRYFKKALDGKDLRAAVPIEYIRRIYKVERVANERGVDADERLRLRQELSRPVYEKLGAWIRDLHGREPPKTRLGKALTYAINHWTALGRFLEDGRLPLDNGESERGLRKVALGRLNWLFAGSDAGGERAAVIYTLIGTCLINKVNPFDYLRDVFAKIAAGWPKSRLDELLPPNWAAAQQQLEQDAA